MIIGSCGYGATGSSVLTDLLSEYEDVQVYDDFEFVMAYRVDGLQDLEYHLMKQYAKNSTGDYAIKRFLYAARCYMTPGINKPCSGKEFLKLSENFINNILQTTYKGVDTADMLSGNVMRNIFAFGSKKVIMPKIIEKLTKKPSYIWPCRKLYYSIEPEKFYEEAKKYINNILKAMGVDLSKPVCLDQPFEGNAPQHSFPFFDDPYAIVIDRDPRDLYLAGKYTRDPNFKFTPKENIDDFIIYYKNMRRKQEDNERVLRLHFEDFIYEYEESVQKIEKFLNLGRHVKKKQIFNPDKSINNTQLIRLHPEDKEAIKKIEKELVEFLYPFERYENIKINGKPFDGAARKAFSQ